MPVGRSPGAGLGADDDGSPHVGALRRPLGNGSGDELRAGVDVREQAIVELEHGLVDAAERELARRHSLFQGREQRPRVHAGKRPGLRHGARGEKRAEELRRDERAVHRQDEAGLVGGGAEPCHEPEHRRAIARPVVEHRERQLEPVSLLPHDDDLGAHRAEHPPGPLGERLAAEARKRLRGAEALRVAADEQQAGRVYAIRQGSV